MEGVRPEAEVSKLVGVLTLLQRHEKTSYFGMKIRPIENDDANRIIVSQSQLLLYVAYQKYPVPGKEILCTTIERPPPFGRNRQAIFFA